jgi:hypothetical protein
MNVVAPPERIVTGLAKAASIRARAGSALRLPTLTSATETPAGISGVVCEAGAAAHARPAAMTNAAAVLSTGRN